MHHEITWGHCAAMAASTTTLTLTLRILSPLPTTPPPVQHGASPPSPRSQRDTLAHRSVPDIRRSLRLGSADRAARIRPHFLRQSTSEAEPRPSRAPGIFESPDIPLKPNDIIIPGRPIITLFRIASCHPRHRYTLIPVLNLVAVCARRVRPSWPTPGTRCTSTARKSVR